MGKKCHCCSRCLHQVALGQWHFYPCPSCSHVRPPDNSARFFRLKGSCQRQPARVRTSKHTALLVIKVLFALALVVASVFVCSGAQADLHPAGGRSLSIMCDSLLSSEGSSLSVGLAMGCRRYNSRLLYQAAARSSQQQGLALFVCIVILFCIKN